MPIINRKGRTPPVTPKPERPIIGHAAMNRRDAQTDGAEDLAEQATKATVEKPMTLRPVPNQPAPVPVQPKKPAVLPPPTKEEQAKAVAFWQERKKPDVLKWLDAIKPLCTPSLTSAEESDMVAVGVRSSAADRETLLRIFRRCASSKK